MDVQDHCTHECTAPVTMYTRPAQMWALASLTCPSQSGFLQLIASVEQISIFSEGEPPLLLTCSSQVDGSTLMSIWEVQIELFEMEGKEVGRVSGRG